MQQMEEFHRRDGGLAIRAGGDGSDGRQTIMARSHSFVMVNTINLTDLQMFSTGCPTTLDTQKFGWVPGPLWNQALRKYSGVQFMFIKPWHLAKFVGVQCRRTPCIFKAFLSNISIKLSSITSVFRLFFSWQTVLLCKGNVRDNSWAQEMWIPKSRNSHGKDLSYN